MPTRATRAGLTVVVAVFALSVVLRIPNLGQPLGRDHEWLTAQTLRMHEIWAEDGLIKNSLLQVHTYPGRANRFIHNHGRLMDDRGIEYHTSYPVVAYVAPYVVFRAAGVRPTPGATQVVSVLIHLASVIALWGLMRRVSAGLGARRREFAAAVSGSAYSVAPLAMWMHANVYWNDMAVQPLFVMTLYAAVRFASATGVSRRRWTAGLVALVLLTTATEWIGVFLAAALVAWALVRRRRSGGIALAIGAGAAVALPVAVHLWHLSLIDGWGPLVDTLSRQFGNRAGLGGPMGPLSPLSWARLVGYYIVGYAGLMLVLIGAIFVVRRVRFTARERSLGWPVLFWLSLAPPVAFHLTFTNLSAIHSYAALKGGPFLIAAGAFAAGRLAESGWPMRRLVAVFATASVISIATYFVWFATPVPSFERLGHDIAAAARSDETVFLVGSRGREPHPAIVLYAQRNIAPWTGRAAARRLMARNGTDRGVVFGTGNGGAIVLERLRR